MAIDLTGIENRNEYYSQHYLLALLEGDLKDLVARWDQTAGDHPDSEEHRPPPAKIRGLGAPYFRLYNRWERLRDPAARLAAQTDWLRGFLSALHYQPQTTWRTVAQGGLRLPLLTTVEKGSGAPLLWVLPVLPPTDSPGMDPLSLGVDPAQYAEDPLRDDPQETGNQPGPEATWEEIITRHIFSLDEPPRWVLLASFGQICLIDRTKWPERRYLAFDLREIFNRREESTLRATAALLHRESICPAEGFALLDTLDENSHRHAFSVSEDLKDAVRESVELLGNEAVYYMREVRHDKVFSTPDDKLAQELTRGCLRYLYRLLFIHYLEARPDLGYLPVKSEEYLQGYSLESLRDLELVALETDRDRDGCFFDRSVRMLFRLIFQGRLQDNQGQLGASIRDDFRISPLKSHLFDPANAPLIEKVRFRNHVLQAVIRSLSLGKHGSGRHARAGRISYAQLGINQLGAVYENLLAYTGFFAKTDLFEVKPSDEEYNPLVHAYFVTEEELAQYRDEERVYAPAEADMPRRLLRRQKGDFIYRLAGRSREKSASYYTPESLTKCLVKYALKELLPGKTADEILNLTVCEMAAGSAAFLNEAIDQLAEAYLRLKQKETGQTLSHDDYAREKQRVKMRLADGNVFGVDLNPTAVELAEISLWLNTIYEGAHVPWFGMQLANGNSLIGARRQTTPADVLVERAGRGGDKARWTESVPDRVDWPTEPLSAEKKPALPPREKGAIYHWLVPDSGMSVYSDKVVKELKRQEIAAINAWRKTFCKAFTPSDMKTLADLSDAADKLWQRHLDACVRLRLLTTDELPVWPDAPSTKPPTTTQWKDEQWAKTIRQPYSPYSRLKLAMDYWCALWFWPIEKADLLPTRDQFLMEMSVLLGVTPTAPEPKTRQGEFDFVEVEVAGVKLEVQPDLSLDDPAGIVNVNTLCERLPRLSMVRDIANKRRFFHWELEFVDVFASRGGFDLIAGNPPWVKIEWNEGGLLSERNPEFAVRKLSASRIAALRARELARPGVLTDYLNEYEEFEGSQNFLNALQNYPLLKGQQTNLYRCFITHAWEITSGEGITGFLHPEGVYDDPKAGALRRTLYARLRSHFQFQNGMFLFAEVAHRTKFSVNIYGPPRAVISFHSIANVFAVRTVDACFAHEGHGAVPGIKSSSGDEDDASVAGWTVAGHRDRVVAIDSRSLEVFAKLYDAVGTPPAEARLPTIHAQQLVQVLDKFSAYRERLGAIGDKYYSIEMWHETNSQKDGTLKRETRFPTEPRELILAGPHFFVANPCSKTPRAICTEKGHYDVLDLEALPEDYLPRTNYIPACLAEEYRRRTRSVPWTDRRPVTEFYRLIHRRMLSQAGERTLLATIAPKSVAHLHTVVSTCFAAVSDLLRVVSWMQSLPADFATKTTGKGDLTEGGLAFLPLLPVDMFLFSRTVSLNCLTSHYANLWEKAWDDAFRAQAWLGDDERLDPDFWKMLTPVWGRECGLRTAFARRWALLEQDVVAARYLRLTLEELQTIYRIQFPVLCQNEKDTWYDQKGRIVFTCSKGLPGVGLTRAEWNDVKDLQSGTVTRQVTDNTLPTGPVERSIVYHAPFTRCDRERDYATVWGKLEECL